MKLDYPRSTPNFWQGVYGWVIGWGDRSTTSWRSDYPYRKHEVSLPIMTNYECLEAYGNLLKGAETISSGMICTGWSGAPTERFISRWGTVGTV